jgi:pyruvyl transferase EpsI
LGIDDRAALIKTASEKGLHVSHYDTHIGDKTLTSDQREKELNRIWGAFRESKLVITDRLHGMIFCAITNTPCIAINNNNGKVKDVYFSWLKDLNYIRITDHIQSNDISRMVDELTTIAEQTIAGPQLNNSFKGLTAERVE